MLQNGSRLINHDSNKQTNTKGTPEEHQNGDRARYCRVSTTFENEFLRTSRRYNIQQILRNFFYKSGTAVGTNRFWEKLGKKSRKGMANCFWKYTRWEKRSRNSGFDLISSSHFMSKRRWELEDLYYRDLAHPPRALGLGPPLAQMLPLSAAIC